MAADDALTQAVFKRLRVDKVIAINTVCIFLAHPVCDHGT